MTYAFSWLDIDDAGKVRFIGREDKIQKYGGILQQSCGLEGLVDKEKLFSGPDPGRRKR